MRNRKKKINDFVNEISYIWPKADIVIKLELIDFVL